MYHVNPETGESGPCGAHKGKCPYGKNGQNHYKTEAEAKSAGEAIAKNISGKNKTALRKNSVNDHYKEQIPKNWGKDPNKFYKKLEEEETKHSKLLDGILEQLADYQKDYDRLKEKYDEFSLDEQESSEAKIIHGGMMNAEMHMDYKSIDRNFEMECLKNCKSRKGIVKNLMQMSPITDPEEKKKAKDYLVKKVNEKIDANRYYIDYNAALNCLQYDETVDKSDRLSIEEEMERVKDMDVISKTKSSNRYHTYYLLHDKERNENVLLHNQCDFKKPEMAYVYKLDDDKK